MLQAVSLSFTFIGAVVMLVTAIKYARLVKILSAAEQNRSLRSRIINNILLAVPFFFVFGYIVGGVDLLRRQVEPIYYFVVTVFFAASLFLLALIKNLASLAEALNEKNKEIQSALKQIEGHNLQLQVEIDRRVQEIVRHDKLLRSLNSAASILLASDVKDFNTTLTECMGMLAVSAEIDCVYVWQNSEDGGVPLARLCHGWSAEPGRCLPESGISISNPADKAWVNKLASGLYINGPVRELPLEIAAATKSGTVVSALVVPVILKTEFWGFVCFGDCRAERKFPDEVVKILHSGSLLIANSVMRNEMTGSLMRAREEALSSTKAKSDFLANMSHEIRTPINAITGMATIASSTEDVQKIRDCLSKIEAASRQLLGIINDVLDMSKIEANKLVLANEPFDLIATVNNIKSIAGVRAAEKGQTFTVNIAPDVPQFVVGDDMRLSQILLNLLSNAVKFTGEEGAIHLSMHRVGSANGRHTLEASVLDNGIGITQEQINRLFDKFEQADPSIARRFGGTGLGLVISKKIALLMGGDITVESEIGQGSCFTARFVLQEGERQMLQSRVSAGSAQKFDFSGRTVLLAEDVEINREIVLALLESTGINIDCAENGQVAADMFQSSPEKYDLIFMDVHMPVMDGYSATRLIRSMNLPRAKAIPIIAMTANAFSEDVANCIKAGMNDHVPKPIDVAQLLNKTSKYL